MPVRGVRSIWPKKGKPPTGIFGQPQKKDDTSMFPNQGTQRYAKDSSTRTKPPSATDQSKRHQPHKRIWK